MKLQQFISPFVIIAIAIVLRLAPHPPNMAPIAAMALFGGCYLNKRYALIVPFIVMIVSDFFIGFHTTMAFVYGSFFLTGLLGVWLGHHKTLYNVLFVSLLSSFLFFFITNFGVWIMGGLYPKTVSGLFESYFYALPFFRNTIIGDLFYTGMLFGLYELVKILIQSRGWVRTK